MTEALGTYVGGMPARIDITRLVGTHLCVQGNSGAGKSGLIRKLLEISHGQVQHIVLDVEDEFYTLREKFDYVIAGGDNGDCPVSIETAPQLMHMLLEHGISAIVQINTLPLDKRRTFVRVALEALIGAPRKFWHPALIVLDEADRYCPQGRGTESADAVIALMDQGRKRGFTGILATQRLAKIDKDATGSVNNWLMGRVGQTIDRRTVADALGFAPSSEEARHLQYLQARQFWGFGPAISPAPGLLTVGDTKTTILRAGQAKVPTPPAPEKMRGILAAIAAAPKADSSYAPLTSGRLSTPQHTADEIMNARKEGYKLGQEDANKRHAATVDTAIETLRSNATTLSKGAAELQQRVADLYTLLNQSIVTMLGSKGSTLGIQGFHPSSDRAPAPPAPIKATATTDVARSRKASPSGEPAGRRLLAGLAHFTGQVLTWKEVSIAAAMIHGNGYFYGGASWLRAKGYIVESPSGVQITAKGVEAAGGSKPSPTAAELAAPWTAKLKPPAGIMMDVFLSLPETDVTVPHLATVTGLKPGNGYWYAGIAKLRDNGLIDQPNKGVLRLSAFMRKAAQKRRAA